MSITRVRKAWQDKVKESEFTMPLTKISGLHREALAEGHLEVVELADVWLQGLTKCKTFLKAHRELNKTKNKQDKLLSMHKNMSEMVTFLQTQKQPFAPSLLLLCLKTEFLASVEETKSTGGISQALLPLMGKGMSVALADMESDLSSQGISSSAWLRGMLMPGLASAISEWCGDPSSQEIAHWSQDLDIVLGTLRSGVPGALGSELLEDLQTLRTVLFGAQTPPKVSASLAAQALKTLRECRRLSDVHEALKASDGGECVLNRASSLILRNAQDEAADARLAAAQSILKSPGLLVWTSQAALLDADGAGMNDEGDRLAGPPTLVFGNAASMKKGLVVEVLNESMLAAQEALSMWSDAGREEGMAAVRRWFASLLESTEKADLYMSFRLFADMAAHGFVERHGGPWMCATCGLIGRLPAVDHASHVSVLVAPVFYPRQCPPPCVSISHFQAWHACVEPPAQPTA